MLIGLTTQGKGVTTMTHGGYRVGDKVICNGHIGTIIRLVEWDSQSVEIQMPRGVVHKPVSEIRPA